MTRLELREKLAFLVVGGTATVCYVALAGGLHFLGLSPATSSAAAYSLCIPPTYLAQRRYTFRSAQAHSVGLIRFVGTQGAGMLVASLSTSLATTVAGWAALPAFLLSAVAAASVTYFLQKLWVFRGSD
jgi:putative flippase GtrA